MVNLAKLMTASAFAGAIVSFVGLAWIKIDPHPTSMFFHPAWQMTNLAVLWVIGSFILFAGVMTILIVRDR